MKRILFVFLDGVGLGPAGPQNPFSTVETPHLEALAGKAPWTDSLADRTRRDHLVRSLDATLGVEGLPQSGTGQATLFTGVNCASIVGRHFGPFPHSATYDALETRSLFHRLQAIGSLDPESSVGAPSPRDWAAFANAYPPQFFETVRNRGRWTVTTRACAEASIHIRDADALRSGRALAADLTGAAWREQLGLDVPQITAAESGRRLVDLSRDYPLTLFEYFLTDKLGHGRLDEEPGVLLRQIDRFIGAILTELDPARETLLLTSDHGNLEDLGSTTHTRNPVPLFVHGWAAPYFRSAASLTDVTPALVAALRAQHGDSGTGPDRR
jgi:hypothetical protein